MKKVSSSASYSEFRKKNPNAKEPGLKDAGIFELDQLTKQLQALNPLKKMNSYKYDHPNGIIEEEEEDDTCVINPNIKIKAQNSATKKLKVLTTKLQPTSAKLENSKLNKSIENPGLSRRQKQIVTTKQINVRNPPKVILGQPKKQEKDPKLSRRMSLTTLGKSSLISTNESLNTTVSQSQTPISIGKKKQMLDKLAEIEAKIAKKSIPAYFFQEIMEKMEKIEQVLDDC